jgi:uncharacterized protein YecE (DUF72 family)
MNKTLAQNQNNIYVGTAAWGIPKEFKPNFPIRKSILESYSQVFNAVEINTSFYREHKSSTYAKWREMTTKEFKFSVKLWQQFTHKERLSLPALENFQRVLEGMSHLEEKLAVVVVQLPPSLSFQAKVAENFFITLRKYYKGQLVLEPRHESWNQDKVWNFMKDLKINKVMADPELCPYRGQSIFDCAYFRLHGTPEVYKSNYDLARLKSYHQELTTYPDKIAKWCIFDNTTFGFATKNALEFKEI